MKKITFTLILLLRFAVNAQNHKEALKLNYNKSNGVFSNKDYKLQAVSFHHLEDKLYYNERDYINNVYNPKSKKDIYIKKYIFVINLANNKKELLEYWVREDNTVLVLYFEISKHKEFI